MISVIVPTFQNPKVLEVCLSSLINGQTTDNQIIVVVDGFYELNKDVLEEYSKYIDVLNLEENVGLCRGTNLGVYNAKHDLILIINDDNVAPNNWDIKLESLHKPNSVISPNQIEPRPSIFSQFNIRDLGNVDNFDFWEFLGYSDDISINKIDSTGGTLPIFMSKIDYLRVGGWDENYPLGLVADWDFFYKCQLSGMELLRTYDVHFYHFGSVSTPNRSVQEQEAWKYFQYKWGGYLKNNINNQKEFIKI
jgi:GT2 family glycosyltransferase